MCGTVRLPGPLLMSSVKALHSLTQSRVSKVSSTFSKLYTNLVKLSPKLLAKCWGEF